MGGWLALLAARALNEAGETERVKGLILIAPAVDFTEALVWAKAPDEARRAIMEEGVWRRPSAYSSEPDCLTRGLIEDGRKHLMLGGMIRIRAPIMVLQGMRDQDVPFSHALALMQRLGDPATLTLVKDGDHRLSRPQDLQLIFDALGRMVDLLAPHPRSLVPHPSPPGSFPRRAEPMQTRAVDLEPDFGAVGSGVQPARELPEQG